MDRLDLPSALTRIFRYLRYRLRVFNDELIIAGIIRRCR